MRGQLAKPPVSLAVMVLFGACVGIALRLAWNPPIKTYVEYLPIGAVFAGLIWDRLFPEAVAPCAASYDAAVVVLAALRVIVPPLPFASGHSLLAAYAAITARHPALRTVAVVVLTHVLYDKLFLAGGAVSMLLGLVIAIGLAALRRRC